MGALDAFNQANAQKYGGLQAGTSRNNNLSAYDIFLSQNDPELRKKIERHYANRKSFVLESGLKSGMSWESIAEQSGIPLEEVKSYSEQTRPDYGVKPQEKKRNPLSVAYDTINPLDSGRSLTTATPSAEGAKKSVWQQGKETATGFFSGVEKVGDSLEALTGITERRIKHWDEELQKGNISREQYQTLLENQLKDTAWAGTGYDKQGNKDSGWDNLKKAAGVSLEATSEIVPFMKAGKAAQLTTKGGTAFGAATGLAHGTGQELTNPEGFNPVNVAIQTGAGGVLGAGGGFVAQKFRGKELYSQLQNINRDLTTVDDNVVIGADDLSRAAKNSLLNNPENRLNKADRLQGKGYSYQEAATGRAKNGKDIAGRIVLGKNDKGEIIIKDGTHLLEAYRDLGTDIPANKIKLEDNITPSEIKTSALSVQKNELVQELKKVRRVDPEAIAGRQVMKNDIGKEANAIQRAFMSTAGKLSRMGKSGQELSNRLHEIEYRAETLTGEWTSQIKTVMGLKNKEFTQFVDALESLSKGEEVKLAPKIQQAVDEWKQLAPTMREAALQAGYDVGDLGEYYFPKNYTKLLSTANGRQSAAKHLVDTGQAENIGEAFQALDLINRHTKINPYGHLVEHRVLDLPDFDKTKKSLAEYIHFTAKTVGEGEQLGPKNEIGQELISKIVDEGFDGAAADRMLKVAMGQARGGDTAEKVSTALRRFNALRSLRTAAISNAGQTANTATVSGWTNTIKAIPKLFSKETRDYIQKTGVTADAILSDIQQQYGLDKGWSSFISAPVFKQVEKFNRSLAAIAGQQWADDLAIKAANGNTKALKQLRKLGVTGDVLETLTPEQRVRASRGLVERTQFKISPKDLPEWTSSPQGKLVAQFRTFAYKQSKFMVDEILKPAAEGNFAPMARFMAALPLGYAVSQTKNFVRTNIEGGEDYSGDDFVSAVKESFDALGGGGLLGTATFAADKFGKPSFDTAITSAIGGPTAGYAYDLAQNIGAATMGSPDQLKRQLVKSVPLVGNTLSNRLVPYEKSAAAELEDRGVGEQLAKESKLVQYSPEQPNRKQNGKELSDKEYDTYKSLYYTKLQNNLSALFDLEQYQAADNNLKKELIKKVVNISGDQTRKELYGKPEKKKSSSTDILKGAGIGR